MTFGKIALLVTAGALVAACGEKQDKTVDRFIDSKHLSTLKAGILVDPDGCDTWLIDDGAEGYWMRRYDKYGKPVCSGVAPPGVATGPYNKGTPVTDPI
ncbi:hypothetical protein [Shimia biformata]|uniref:hypothetical protein n=1 Tax=Shimia biformata TaxID=1294299 RepID=UPI00195284B9|nr:hypothetical protein [Shimia biformata]